MQNFTFEVSHKEPIHPDPQVAATFYEADIAMPPYCDHGCKIYANQRSDERILAHNSAYGCRK